MAVDYIGFNDFYLTSGAIAVANKVVQMMINFSDNPITINSISCVCVPPITYSQFAAKLTLIKTKNEARIKPIINGSITPKSPLNKTPNNIAFGSMGIDVYSSDRSIFRTSYISISPMYQYNPSMSFPTTKPEYASIYENNDSQIQSIILRKNEGLLLLGDFTSVANVSVYTDFTI